MSEINYTDLQKSNDKMAFNFNKDVDPTAKYGMLLSGEGFVCFKPGLDEPNKDDKYTLAVAFPEGSLFHKQLTAKVKEVVTDEFGPKVRGLKSTIKSGTKYFDRKLETLEEEGADDEEIEKFKKNNRHLKGCFYLNLWTKFPLNDPAGKRKPNLIGPNMAPIEADEVSGQDIVRVKFLLWPFDRDGNKGVTVCLNACQKLADGNFSGGGDGNNTDGFEAMPVVDGEDESTGGFSPQDENDEPPEYDPAGDMPEEAPAPVKKKRTPKKKAVPVEEPEEVEEDDDGEGYEEDGMSDDDVFDQE